MCHTPRYIRLPILALILLVTTACSCFPIKQFDKQANSEIKKVGILKVDIGTRISVVNQGSIFAAFAVAGAIAHEVDARSKSESFSAKVAPLIPNVSSAMVKKLQDGLTDAGYQPVYLEDQSLPVNDLGVVDGSSISKIQTTADALLHIQIASAYVATPLSLDYVPHVIVVAQLVGTKTRSPLYSKVFLYGVKTGAIRDDVQCFSSDSRYAYGSFDALMQHYEEAIGGIEAGAGLIGSKIAEQLSRQPTELSAVGWIEERNPAIVGRGMMACHPSRNPAYDVRMLRRLFS